MEQYESFKQLFEHIRQIKQYVITLRGNKLHQYCIDFYAQKYKEWWLDLLWEFIFDDRTYDEIETIFKNNNII